MWRAVVIFGVVVADEQLSEREAKSFLRTKRTYHDQTFEQQCIEQDCSRSSFVQIVNNRADATKLWNDFTRCANSVWSKAPPNHRKNSIRACLNFDKMVSQGQGNNRPQARLSETGPSQWIQQITKHGEKYPTVVIRSAADLRVKNTNCHQVRRNVKHCTITYSNRGRHCQLYVKVTKSANGNERIE